MKTFGEVVERFTKVPASTVQVQDFYVDGQAPYRYATVVVTPSADDAPTRTRDLALLAVEVGGYLTLSVHAHGCHIQIGVSRLLAPEEQIRPGDEVAFPVSMGAALTDRTVRS